MDINVVKLKSKKPKTVYDWRFWIKLIPAIFPLASTIIFCVAQGVDMFHDPHAYWWSTLHMSNYTGINSNKENPYFGKDVWDAFNYYMNLTSGQMVGYLICRNILMLTTIGNIFNSSFFINSARNNGRYEGQGSFDNYKWGISCMNTIIFIVLFYNISLAFQNDFGHMKWYNWESWFSEHSVPQIVMIVYFFAAYPKKKTVQDTKMASTPVKRWFDWMFWAILPTIGFMVVFTVLGYIIQAGHGLRYFGEMSSTGYFPYSFLDFTNNNHMVPEMVQSFMKPWSDFVVIMIVLCIQQVVFFEWIFAVCEYQVKHGMPQDNKKMKYVRIKY